MDFTVKLKGINYFENEVALLAAILGIDLRDSEARSFFVVVFSWNGFYGYFSSYNFMSGANDSAL